MKLQTAILVIVLAAMAFFVLQTVFLILYYFDFL